MNIRTKFLLGTLLTIVVFYGGYTLGASDYNWESIVAKKVESTTVPKDIKDADFAPLWKTWALLDEKIAPFKASQTDVVTNQQKVWGAIQGLAASYNDPYTAFFPPEESKAFGENVKGEFGGVGIEIVVKDNLITVVAPLKGTPAEKAGIKPNDRIIKIDGTSALDISLNKAVSLMHGEPGTKVALTIAREGESKEIQVDIIRAIIEVPTIKTELKDGVFVITLFGFTENSAPKFRDALVEFGALYDKNITKKLVIDLRNNPGGYLESAVDIASFFLPEGTEIVREVGNKSYKEKIYRSKGFDVFKNDLKLAVLINGGSASASEIVASALQDHKKAILVGEKSFGKGSVQELIPITKDTSLKVTIARWLTPKGNSISDGGVTPDIVVEKEKAVEGQISKDVQLLRAIAELNKK